jgi:hypothetical protein
MALEWVYPEDRETRIRALKDEMNQHLQNYMRCRRVLRELQQDEADQRPLSLVQEVLNRDEWVAVKDPDDDDLTVWRKAFDDDDDGPSGLGVKVPA